MDRQEIMQELQRQRNIILWYENADHLTGDDMLDLWEAKATAKQLQKQINSMEDK